MSSTAIPKSRQSGIYCGMLTHHHSRPLSGACLTVKIGRLLSVQIETTSTIPPPCVSFGLLPIRLTFLLEDFLRNQLFTLHRNSYPITSSVVVLSAFFCRSFLVSSTADSRCFVLSESVVVSIALFTPLYSGVGWILCPSNDTWMWFQPGSDERRSWLLNMIYVTSRILEDAVFGWT